jgi:hypothetical protein
MTPHQVASAVLSEGKMSGISEKINEIREFCE